MGHVLFPSYFAFFDHCENVIGDNVEILDICVVDILKLVVVNQIPEDILQVIGQLLFEIL